MYTRNLVLRAAFGLSIIIGVFSSTLYADDPVTGSRAINHAPLGVMGDHTHKRGELMFSYRLMYMDMAGNRMGTDSISAEEIATTVPNRLAGNPMQPPTLRVVPTQMSMQMNMFGLMYAPSDQLTLMMMANYIKSEMDHVTFKGPAGSERLGTFTTRSSGLGDTKVSGLIKLYDTDRQKLHMNIGVSLPTGSITKKDQVLTPMGGLPELRLPYAMQLGSGTYDLLAGATYRGFAGNWNWGGQYLASIRTDENGEGYTLGDEHTLNVWGAYSFSDAISTSLRMSYIDADNIDGFDPEIQAPVQTADPDNYGKQGFDIHAGLNWLSHSGHRLAIEISAPIYQDLDGTQLETDWSVTAGYQFAF